MRKLLFLLGWLALPLILHAQNGAAGTVINAPIYCATSNDGSVVGLPNPLQKTIVSAQFSGTLQAGTYYTEYSWYDFTGKETLVSPEIITQLTGTGQLTVAIPTGGLPTGAAGMRIYIGGASGAETFQGATVGTLSYVQSVPLVSGASPQTVNGTKCMVVANDALWPTGTGYTAALTDSHGNSLPGYPMQWQLMGPGTTINLSSGLPYYHGNVIFPTPILATPLNHATQSISGGLNINPYALTVGNLTITGTCTGCGGGGGGGSTIYVNGNLVTNPNFNSLVPPPPSGSTNIVWNYSGSSASASIPFSVASANQYLLPYYLLSPNGTALGGMAGVAGDASGLDLNISGVNTVGKEVVNGSACVGGPPCAAAINLAIGNQYLPTGTGVDLFGPASGSTYGMTVPTGTAAPAAGNQVYVNSVASVSGVPVAQLAFNSQAFSTLTDAATVTWAIGGSPQANAGLTFTSHSGSRTLNLTGLVSGGIYSLWIKQDSTGGEGLTLGTGCTWKVSGGGSGAITPSSGASAIDELQFNYDGTNCYLIFTKNFT